MHHPSNSSVLGARKTISRMAVTCSLWALCACSNFGQPDAQARLLLNSCQNDGDCRADQRCQNEQCVVRAAMAEQTILLQITPEYAPNGADAMPLYTELSRIDGTTNRDIELPPFVPVTFRLRLDGQTIPGELRLVTVADVIGLSIPSHSVTAPKALDELLWLTSGATMRIQAIPLDTSLPPLEKTVEVSADLSVDFDLDSQAASIPFKFVGLPPSSTFVAVAKSPESGRRVSSTATVENDTVSLNIAPLQTDYILELKYTPSETAPEPNCDNDETQIPSYRVLVKATQQEVDEERVINIPRSRPTIHYGGSVELCEDTKSTPDVLENLTVNLRSTELSQEAPTPMDPVMAAPYLATPYFQQDLQTKFNSNSGLLEFCGPAIPGDYDIVVNAPASLGTCITENGKLRCGCGIFAENRVIAAPPESTVQFGTILPLPSLASIFGTLRNVDGQAIAGAAVEAVALGRITGIILDDKDQGLTAYNRSRQTTSDADGSFRVPLDVGSYDVTIKPPPESGFAWTVMEDLRIANRSEEFSQGFTAISPVTVTGNLRFLDGPEADDETLVGAVIRAHALIDDGTRPGGKRVVVIGQTTATEGGAFVLRIPPTIRHGWQ